MPTNVVIRATISAAGGVVNPTVFYRRGPGDFTTLPMVPKGAGRFEATLPADELKGIATVDYYLTAWSQKDLSQGEWHTAEKPFHLKLGKPVVRNIHVRTVPPRAMVQIDGEVVGPAPFIVPIEPGKHRATAQLEGYFPADIPFKMPPVKDFPLVITMKKDRNWKPPPPVAPPPQHVGNAAAPELDLELPSNSVEAGPPAPPLAVPPAIAAVPVAQPCPTPAPDPPPSTIPDPPVVKGEGHIRIITEPPGAAITVDGKEAGDSPVTVNLAPGDYIVAARLKPYKNGTRIIKIVADEQSDRFLKLRLKPPPAAH